MGRSSSGSDQCDGVSLSQCQNETDEQPEFMAFAGSYYFDNFEVTIGRFRKFVEAYDNWRAQGNPSAGSGFHPTLTSTGWDSSWDSNLPASSADLRQGLPCEGCWSWTDSPGPNENMPVACVTWYEAQAFCIWDGGRLPLEVEWEAAAAGGDDNRRFPWGASDPDLSKAWYMLDLSSPDCPATLYSPVGTHSAGVSRYGQHDLAGNIKEWCFDYYDSAWYAQVSNTCGQGCTNTNISANRVVRGGAFYSIENTLRSANREYRGAAERSRAQGFRCVYPDALPP